MNAAECLLSVGEDRRTALVWEDTQISYGELRDAVAHAAGAWRDLGLRTGDRVLVFMPDGIDWVVGYLSVIWAGGIAVGLNSRLFEKELSVVLVDSGARFILCNEDGSQTLQRLLPGLSIAPRILTLDEARSLWRSAAPLPPEQFPEESPALWIYTSGTTGKPKAVMHAQRMVVETGNFFAEVLGVDATARFYASSKLFFAYALGNSLFSGLRLGATVILDSEWPTPERVVEMIERHRASVLLSVPTLYLKMLQAGVAARLSRAGVRKFVSAGEALPAAVRTRWREATGIAPISCYGASETVSLVLYSDRDDGLLKLSPLVELRPRIAAGQSGEEPHRVWLRHPAVALGYFNRPEAQQDAFDREWFSPGDLFKPVQEGIWEFCGRDDDMLKISGQWVSVLDVEQSLLAASGASLQQVAAVGYTNAEGLSSIALFAVAAAGKEREALQRLEAGISTLPKLKRPRLVKWINELPLTATGKLQRRKLKEVHLSNQS